MHVRMSIKNSVFLVQYGCGERHFLHAASIHGNLFTIGTTCYELVHNKTSWTNAESDCVTR